MALLSAYCNACVIFVICLQLLKLQFSMSFYIYIIMQFNNPKYIIAGIQTEKFENIENNWAFRISYENKRPSIKQMLHNIIQEQKKIAIICSPIQKQKSYKKYFHGKI